MTQKLSVEQKQIDEQSTDLAAKLAIAKDAITKKFWKEDLARANDEISLLEHKLFICTKPFDEKIKALNQEF